MKRLAAGLAVAIVLVGGCGGDDSDDRASDAPADGVPADDVPADDATTDGAPTDGAPTEQRFPDVIGVEVTERPSGLTFDVTISSPYDTPDRYADAWRVVGPDGTVYGTRELTHDHRNEQPFTRSLAGVTIPDEVETVTVEARDQQYGWGGATVDVIVPR